MSLRSRRDLIVGGIASFFGLTAGKAKGALDGVEPADLSEWEVGKLKPTEMGSIMRDGKLILMGPALELWENILKNIPFSFIIIGVPLSKVKIFQDDNLPDGVSGFYFLAEVDEKQCGNAIDIQGNLEDFEKQEILRRWEEYRQGWAKTLDFANPVYAHIRNLLDGYNYGT